MLPFELICCIFFLPLNEVLCGPLAFLISYYIIKSPSVTSSYKNMFILRLQNTQLV